MTCYILSSKAINTHQLHYGFGDSILNAQVGHSIHKSFVELWGPHEAGPLQGAGWLLISPTPTRGGPTSSTTASSELRRRGLQLGGIRMGRLGCRAALVVVLVVELQLRRGVGVGAEERGLGGAGASDVKSQGKIRGD